MSDIDPFQLKPANFPEEEDVGPRDWGKEILLMCASKKYTMKRIKMNKGAKGGLQYHRRKDEAGYVLEGMMKVTYDDGRGNLVDRIIGPGATFHFPTGCIHRIEALMASEYIECSTPHFNDRVHVEHQYGEKSETGGLHTTLISEIETR